MALDKATVGELIREIAGDSTRKRYGEIVGVDADTVRVKLVGSQSVIKNVMVLNVAREDILTKIQVGDRVVVEVSGSAVYASVLKSTL